MWQTNLISTSLFTSPPSTAWRLLEARRRSDQREHLLGDQNVPDHLASDGGQSQGSDHQHQLVLGHLPDSAAGRVRCDEDLRRLHLALYANGVWPSEHHDPVGATSFRGHEHVANPKADPDGAATEELRGGADEDGRPGEPNLRLSVAQGSRLRVRLHHQQSARSGVHFEDRDEQPEGSAQGGLPQDEPKGLICDRSGE